MHYNIGKYEILRSLEDLLMPNNISIQRIVAILLQRIKFIVLLTLVTTLSFFLYSKLFITPMYNTSAMIFVQKVVLTKNTVRFMVQISQAHPPWLLYV